MKVAYDISKELVSRGHSVTVYTTDVKNKKLRVQWPFKEIDGVNVFYLKNLSLFAARKNIFITPSLAFHAEKLSSFDIVHIHGNRTTQSPLIYYFLKKKSIPYVVQAHGGMYSAGNATNRLYDRLFGYRLLYDASKLIALSPFEAEQYMRIGVPNEKIAIIPNGIDLPTYSNLPPKGSFRNKFGIPQEKAIFLYVGRIHRTKGIDFLVRAYAYLINHLKVKNVLLVIAGPDDGYLKEIQDLIASLNLSDSVIFTGFISNDDKMKALADAALFITPSFYGLPLTFLEACVAGVPIITTTMGDKLDWIDGNVGYVTSPKFQDMASAMYAIHTDSKLAENFSNKCRTTIESKFSLKLIVDQLENTYKQVIGT